ncbi:MAG: hypothetical protein AB8B59_01525 [Maribacter sp.]
MKKYILVLASVIFVLSLSCKEEKKESPESNQMEQVMNIHDEVMPKMGKIGSLVSQLRKKIDSDQGGAEEKKAMEDLQDANKSMMDWMQGFGNRFDSDEIMNGKTLTEEKKQWLNEEEEKVNLVKEKINTSIANAEALLAQ